MLMLQILLDLQKYLHMGCKLSIILCKAQFIKSLYHQKTPIRSKLCNWICFSRIAHLCCKHSLQSCLVCWM